MRVKAPFVGCHLQDGDIRTYLFSRVGRWFLPAALVYDGETWHQVVGIVPGTRWGWYSCRLAASWVRNQWQAHVKLG